MLIPRCHSDLGSQSWTLVTRDPEFQWCGWSLTLQGPSAAGHYFSLVTWLGSSIWHNQRQWIFAQASGKGNHCFSAGLHLWGYKIWSHCSILVSRGDLLSEQGSRAERWQKGDQVLSLIKLCLEIIFWKNQLQVTLDEDFYHLQLKESWDTHKSSHYYRGFFYISRMSWVRNIWILFFAKMESLLWLKT